jgi:hypothetical protein
LRCRLSGAGVDQLVVNLKTRQGTRPRNTGHAARPHRVRCNIGGAAVCKASIAAVVLAVGIVSLVEEGTDAMVALPASLRPALTMPAVEAVALRKSVTVTRHVAVRHRGVRVRARHVAVRHRGVARTRHVAAGRRGIAVRTLCFNMGPESETGSRSLSDSYLEIGAVCLSRRPSRTHKSRPGA